MRLVGGEFLPEPGFVERQHVLDLVHDNTLAAGTALVQAEILIGVEISLPVEHTDLKTAMEYDAALALGEIVNSGNEHVRHSLSSLSAR
jgi:hypothetical protein